jgi:hypothetical protein
LNQPEISEEQQNTKRGFTGGRPSLDVGSGIMKDNSQVSKFKDSEKEHKFL